MMNKYETVSDIIASRDKLRQATINVMQYMRDKEMGVLRLGLKDNDSSRAALQELFNLVDKEK